MITSVLARSRHIGQCLRGELTLAAAKQRIKSETHRLVRHQYAWFRAADERIHWFDVQRQENVEVEQMLDGFIAAE